MLYKLKKASCTPNNQNFKKNSKHNWSRETNLFIGATTANYSINALTSHNYIYIIYIFYESFKREIFYSKAFHSTTSLANGNTFVFAEEYIQTARGITIFSIRP